MEVIDYAGNGVLFRERSKGLLPDMASVAGGDAAKRLYPSKEIIDQMAPNIFLSVVAVGAFGSL